MARHLRPILITSLCTAALAVFPAAGSELVLECTAEGYDVLLKNAGSETMVPGTRVLWTVKFVRHSGEFVLKDPLAPAASVFVSGALESDYLSAPQPCIATVE